MSLDELVDVIWHDAPLQLASASQLLGDVFRYVLRPAFGRVEGNDADRVGVFTREQAKDHVFQIGRFDVGFAVSSTISSEVVHDNIDALIVTRGHDRRSP